MTEWVTKPYLVFDCLQRWLESDLWFISDVQVEVAFVIQMMIRETSTRVSATSDDYLSKLSGPSRQMKTIHFFLAVHGLVNPYQI